jgi:hypothetical protein
METIEIPVFYTYKEAINAGFAYIDESETKGNDRDGYYKDSCIRAIEPFYFRPRDCFFNRYEIVDRNLRKRIIF